MQKSFYKNVIRTIKSSLGRYIALILIVMLGVVFYVGLKVSTTDMLDTAQEFYDDHNFYDYCLVSSYGFDKEDFEKYIDEDVLGVEGAYFQDVIISDDKEDTVARIHTLTKSVNSLNIKSGRLPEAADECVLDSRYYGKEYIGKCINISESNSEATLENVNHMELKVVGIVDSPLYLSYQRGTTTVGDGSIGLFAFVCDDFFKTDYYTQVFISVQNGSTLYSDEYDKLIDSKLDKALEWANKASSARYDNAYEAAKQTYDYYLSQNMISKDDIPENYGVPELTCSVLTRSDNQGYATYKDNADIVKSIAYIFPIFFVIVAALVCVTTMSRMVEDERTQLGVLKALGYSKVKVLFKYIFYSLSATIIGGIIGFYVGSFLFPTMIWKAYTTMYTYTDSLNIVHDYSLLAVSLLAAIIVIVGTTVLTCARVLRESPAEMIRPKAPQPGKRVLLERVGFIWKHLPFLYKVSIRNCFRYKKRFFMMLIGIAGCTSILIIGFGIKDSICDICDLQYNEINTYDYLVAINDDATEEDKDKLYTELDEYLEDYCVSSKNPIDIDYKGYKKEITSISIDDFDKLDGFINLSENGKKLSNLKENEIAISSNLLTLLDAKKGDKITIKFQNLKEKEYKIGAVYKNYVSNIVVFNDSSYKAGCGVDPVYNCIYAHAKKDLDIYEGAASIGGIEGVANVSATLIMRDYFDEMVKSLNSIVYLVLICAAVLAFVVMYNLNNINIMERVREIATIKVLGFYRAETSIYVFRENLILTVLGVIAGIPLGKFMHQLVMDKIRIEIVCFDIHVNTISYVLSAVITIIFAILVDLVMRHKIHSINMSESLKSIE